MGLRRSTRDFDFYIEDDTFHGLIFGWDFTADHEWGTEGIEKAFGLQIENNGEAILGIDRTIIRKVPDNLYLIKNKYKGVRYTHLVLSTFFDAEDIAKYEPIEPYACEDYSVHWCSNRFSISVKGARNPKARYLEELYKAIQDENAIYLWTHKKKEGATFGRTSPTIFIKDKLDDEFIQSIYDYDLDCKQLADAVEATGIEDYLKKNGCGYYGLKPAWTATGVKETNDGRVIKTEHPVIFFLNPNQQKEFNSGWFTVEDLMLWPKGVGPIPKNKQSNSKDWILVE